MLEKVKGFIGTIVTAGVIARKVKAKVAAINDDTAIDEDKKPQLENMKELGVKILSDGKVLALDLVEFYKLAADLFTHVMNAKEK